jgi:hypothetical protein
MLFEDDVVGLFLRPLCSIPVGLDLFRSMQICCRFPCVVAVWIALPFNEVLELLCSSKVAVFGLSAPLHILLHLL